MSLPVSDPVDKGPEGGTSDRGAILDRVLGLIAAMILIALMLLTTVDVVSRKLGDVFGGKYFGSLRGSFELTELALLVLIFAGLPLTSRRGEHVTLDFIDKALGRRGANVWRRVVEFFVGLVFAGLTWQVWIKAGKVSANGDVTDVLRLVVGPFVYLMCAMVAITSLIHFARAVWPTATDVPTAESAPPS
jgi:TRAP-type transport system small permease protein